MTRVGLLFTAALLAAALPHAQAAQLPAGQANVNITAREQPVGAFLRDLLGQLGRTVVVGDGVTGTVNGVFTGPGERVFRDIQRAFGLVSHYDGSTVYVYPASAITTRSFSAPGSAGRIARAAADLGLTDNVNRARAGSVNLVVASGTPRFIEQVGELADRGAANVGSRAGRAGGGTYPAPQPRSEPLEYRVYFLKYARAEDTTITTGDRELRVPGIASVLRAVVLDTRERLLIQSADQYGARPLRQSAQRVGGLGLNRIPADDGGGFMGGYPSGGFPPPAPMSSNEILGYGGGGDMSGGQALMASMGEPARIEANPALNAVIVRDTRDRIAAYDKLIQTLDIEPQLVEIEATIIDINIQKARELGINWRINTSGVNALFGDNGLSSGGNRGLDGFGRDIVTGQTRDGSLSAQAGTTLRQNAFNVTGAGGGLNLSSIIGPGREFISRINALEQRGAARIVSRPQVMTLSNIEAVFSRARTFYVRVQGQFQVDLFNVTAGTVLRVNPHVFRDGDQARMRLIINIEDGAIDASQIVDNIPTVDRATVTTQAIIQAGESLLLGGLTSDADIQNEARVPILGSIPLLGELFKQRARSRTRLERLFLITPRLASAASRAEAAALIPPPIKPPLDPARPMRN